MMPCFSAFGNGYAQTLASILAFALEQGFELIQTAYAIHDPVPSLVFFLLLLLILLTAPNPVNPAAIIPTPVVVK